MAENRCFLVKLLSTIGFEVQEAENGKQAVDAVASWLPDLILMDMSMPVMDGYTATEHIRKTEVGQRVAIIALSAHAFEDQRQKILNVGCDDFISKPYVEEDLFASIEQHLGVQFVCEGLNAKEKSSHLLAADIPTELPENIKADLLAATAVLDQERCLAILEQERLSLVPEIASELSALIENYKFEEIESLLQIPL